MRDEQSDLWRWIESKECKNDPLMYSACSSRFKAAGLQLGLDNIACYRAPSCTILIPSLANTRGEGCAPCSREATTTAAERDEGAGFLGVELLAWNVSEICTNHHGCFQGILDDETAIPYECNVVPMCRMLLFK